jgi:hypothetical protein
LVELREVERNCAITIDAPEKQASAIGLLAKHHYIGAWGTAMERFDMRPLTSVFVALILAIAPVTMASAQVSGTANPLLLAVPSPMLNPNVQNIPAPLPAPSQSPVIDGPMSQSQPDLAPLPAAPPLMGAPGPATSVPSVFQSQTGL